MAGRIRSIKPEILDDEEVSSLSDEAWRLWVSLWLLADDFGNSRAGDRYLAALVWQDSTRSPRISEILRELRKARRVELYENGGERFAHIRNWEKHQRIDNAGKARVDGPEHEDSRPWDEFRGESQRVSEVGGLTSDLRPPTKTPITDRSASPDLVTEVPKREQSALPFMAPLAGDPGKDTKKTVDKHRVVAEHVLGFLNESRRRIRPKSRGIAASYDSLVHIAERLAAGKSVVDCLHVVAVCEAECRRDPNSFQWFDAVSPFIAKNFERKVAADPDMYDAPRGGKDERPRPQGISAEELAIKRKVPA